MEATNNNKTYIWIAVGCLGIIVCAIAVVVFGFGGLVWLGSQTPDNVKTTVNAPLNAINRDDIEITVSITNTGADILTLTSIDISLNYLNGFVITETNPLNLGTGQYDALGGGETFQTYSFQIEIDPGETLTVQLIGKAVVSGDFSGTFYICIDNTFNCATNVVRSIVK